MANFFKMLFSVILSTCSLTERIFLVIHFSYVSVVSQYFVVSPLSDIRRIGICLIGHQRRIISSIQSLRLQLHHIQQSGFQV